jgi:hypothetical protein
VSWSLRFAEPIVLEDRAKLTTLRQAIAHLVKTIPAAKRGSPTVPTAAELLTNGRAWWPIEFARIATLQPLTRHAFRVFNPDRKDPPWGRQKLKRDTA